MFEGSMEPFGAFFLGGLKSEERSFPGREYASKHRDLELVDVLKQQSRSFDIAGLANVRGNFIFGVNRFANSTELFLILQTSDEFPEVLDGHMRHSRFLKSFNQSSLARLPVRSNPCAVTAASHES